MDALVNIHRLKETSDISRWKSARSPIWAIDLIRPPPLVTDRIEEPLTAFVEEFDCDDPTLLLRVELSPPLSFSLSLSLSLSPSLSFAFFPQI